MSKSDNSRFISESMGNKHLHIVGEIINGLKHLLDLEFNIVLRLGIYPTHVPQDLNSKVFTAALFATGKYWK